MLAKSAGWAILFLLTLAITVSLSIVNGNDSSSSAPEDNSKPSKAACAMEPNYIYPNPKNCSTFYKCWGGRLYPLECPQPLVFNTELRVCDWKWNVTTCDTEQETDYGLGR